MKGEIYMEKKNFTGIFVVLGLVVAAIVVITKIVTGNKEK
jgi:hypothetical protein